MVVAASYPTQSAKGEPGPQGQLGSQGPQGSQGIQGIQGNEGLKGDTGSAGQSFSIVTSYTDRATFDAALPLTEYEEEGNAIILISDGSLMVWNGTVWFDAGDIKGNTGDQGPRGIQGVQGTQGIQGVQGLQGLQGVKGDQGIQGIQGSAGQSFTILGSYADIEAFNAALPLTEYESVGNAFILLSDGSLMTWRTANGGEWFDAGDIRGPQGPQGPQGNDGPQGLKGDTGAQGIQGIQGNQGIQGIQGSAGQSFTILGNFEDRAAFDAALPLTAYESVGNAFILLSDGSLMTWRTLNGGEWFDAGDIRGPQGPVGPAGPQGSNYGLYVQLIDSPTIVNTTAESSLIGSGLGTLSVPANAFVRGDSYLGTFGGTFSSLNGATLRIRVKAGSVILLDSGAKTMPTSTVNVWSLTINFTIRQIGGAGVASIVTLGNFSYVKQSNGSQEGFGFNVVNSTTFSTIVSNALDVTLTWGAAHPNNSIFTDIFVLSKVY